MPNLINESSLSYGLAPLFMMTIGLLIYFISSKFIFNDIPTWSHYKNKSFMKIIYLLWIRALTYVAILFSTLFCGYLVQKVLSIQPFIAFSIFLAIILTALPGVLSIVLLLYGIQLDKKYSKDGIVVDISSKEDIIDL